MAEALSRGNINNVGRTGWAEFIDLLQEVVVDEVNDARVEMPDHRVDQLEAGIAEVRREMSDYRSTVVVGQDENMADVLRNDKKYLDLRKREFDLRNSVDSTVNKVSYPQFCNDTVPEYLYTSTYNNRWEVCYGYVTTDLNRDEMKKFYQTASQHPDQKAIRVDHNERRHKKEAMRTIADMMEQQQCYTCSGKPGYTCPMPNGRKIPDVVVSILPQEPETHLKIPVFVWEVIGDKEIRERGLRQWSGFIAALKCLDSSPYAYYGEVDGDSVTLYKLEKIPGEGRIRIYKETFTYASDTTTPEMLAQQFERIIERLTEIFVDIFLNLTWVKFECSRVMKLAGYTNFVSKQDGRSERGCEMHCWHLFEPLYFGMEKIDEPREYIQGLDKIDPRMQGRREGNVGHIYTIVPDEVVPVFSSNTTYTNIIRAYNELIRAGTVVFNPGKSRAVRNTATGQPLDKFTVENWNNAFNQFRSNISAFMQQKVEGYMAELTHTEFDRYFNPGLLQPRPNQRRQLVPVVADTTVEELFYNPEDPQYEDQEFDDDDDEEDAVMLLDEFDPTPIPSLQATPTSSRGGPRTSGYVPPAGAMFRPNASLASLGK